MELINRAEPASVALETTLLAHGIPRDEGLSLAAALSADVRSGGGAPVIVGVVGGRAVVGMTEAELGELLGRPEVPKLNTANLGVAAHRGWWGATTVSATMELAARTGVRVFATGAIGGVHRGFGSSLDISSDLAALARFPVAVVSSGVKSILDVAATREALEALGVPVVGFRTDAFPSFYRREPDTACGAVDARFDDPKELAAFAAAELARTGRGVVVANPIPEADEIAADAWSAWIERAWEEAAGAGVQGRAVTPFILERLHDLSGGATLRANVSLVRSNALLAGAVAGTMRELEEAADDPGGGG